MGEKVLSAAGTGGSIGIGHCIARVINMLGNSRFLSVGRLDPFMLPTTTGVSRKLMFTMRLPLLLVRPNFVAF